MAKTGKYGEINTTDTNTMGYCVIKLFSESYTLQEYTTCDGQIVTAGELVVKVQHMKCMKDNTEWYWGKTQQQKKIIVPTHTIVHTCIYVIEVTEVKKQLRMYAAETNNTRLYKCILCI